MNSFLKNIPDLIEDAKKSLQPRKGLKKYQPGFYTGIFGGKFASKDEADRKMNEKGYDNYIITDKGNILFNPTKIDDTKVSSIFLNSSYGFI